MIAFSSSRCEKTAMVLGLECICLVFVICQVCGWYAFFRVNLLLLQSNQAEIVLVIVKKGLIHGPAKCELNVEIAFG